MFLEWNFIDNTRYVPTQSLVTPLGEPPGAVSLGRARGVAVDGCSFANLGSAYALSVGGASQQVSVVGSSFTSLAGGAVKLGNVDDERALATSPERMDSAFRVVDNTIRLAALELRGAAAIFAGYVRDTTISHNSVAETGYTAISLGWGWGTHVLGRQTFMRNNHVVSNRMERVVSALNDGGCIYTLGPQPNSTVSLNYCEADRAPVVGSFYHDNGPCPPPPPRRAGAPGDHSLVGNWSVVGSRYFRTTRNVASNSPAPCVYLQGCCGAPALDARRTAPRARAGEGSTDGPSPRGPGGRVARLVPRRGAAAQQLRTGRGQLLAGLPRPRRGLPLRRRQGDSGERASARGLDIAARGRWGHGPRFTGSPSSGDRRGQPRRRRSSTRRARGAEE